MLDAGGHLVEESRRWLDQFQFAVDQRARFVEPETVALQPTPQRRHSQEAV
jgi:hypothetical protein